LKEALGNQFWLGESLMKRKVLITGAAGRIGSFITAKLKGHYDFVLTDLHKPTDSHGFLFVQADITDVAAVRTCCEHVDTVLHLAADPHEDAPWESILPNNITGVYNVFQAAHEAGCQRVIFASSVHVVAGYPVDVQVHTNMPVWPLNLYGAAKAWGEALARFYAEQKDLSVICLRFGWVIDRNSEKIRLQSPNLDVMLTFEDLTRLVKASIEAPPDLRFGIFHGVSNNRWKRLDISDARDLLGYEPKDDAFQLAMRK
jgi:nucleoside-diphosphate-sugar epimerase